MKTLSVVGKGIVGTLAVAHFLRFTDWNVHWIFDENTPISSFGEATNLKLPQRLSDIAQFTGVELKEMNGTVKQGVYKKNWADGTDYLHPFPIGRQAIHFNAQDLQQKLYDYVKNNSRLKISNMNVAKPEELDSDYIMICSGLPSELDEATFNIRKNIPVNSVYAVQCESDGPKFDYSLTNAMPHGWIFGIPLQNRFSVGYLYNDNFITLEDIKKDITNVFTEYDLIPTEKTQTLSFNSFSRKNNFSSKIIYNGNASFFLEPLEATSTDVAYFIIELAYNIWTGSLSPEFCQKAYDAHLDKIESMIALHYAAGSIYKNSFWDYAQFLGKRQIEEQFKNYTIWADFVKSSIEYPKMMCGQEHGTWARYSYTLNINQLKLKNYLQNLWIQNEII